MSSNTPLSPVLIVIDLQEGLVSPPPEEGPRSTPNLTTNIRLLLSHFRSHHFPIIHIHHQATNPIDSLHPSHAETSASHPCATPHPSEPVLYKSQSSGFISTDLAERLQALNVDGEKRPLVMVGMDGAQCVNSTARTAADLDYEVTVVGDGCASFGTAGWRRGEEKVTKGWGPEETNEIAMGMLAGMYAKVVTTEEFLKGAE